MTVLLQVGVGLGQTAKDTLTRKMRKYSLKHEDPFWVLSEFPWCGARSMKWLDDIYTIKKLSTSYTLISR